MRDSFTTEFMQMALVDCVRAKREIKQDIIQDMIDITRDWNMTNEQALERIHSQYNPLTCKKEKVNPFKEVDRAIKSLTILIAKRKNMINLDSWEQKYQHATENVRIEDVVRHYMKDDNFKRRVKCPFHVSKEHGGKHLQVYEKSNSYHCFSCKASGTPLNFVMAMENMTFKEAVEFLDKF